MKRSIRIKRVYRLFDCMTGMCVGQFYRSKNDALRKLYAYRSLGYFYLLERYREYSGYWRQFECFVKSR